MQSYDGGKTPKKPIHSGPDRSRVRGPGPILYFQTWNAVELTLIVGYYRQGCRFRMRGNPQIIVADRRPFGLE